MQFQTGKRDENLHAVLHEIWLGECLEEAEGRKKIEIASIGNQPGTGWKFSHFHVISRLIEEIATDSLRI